MCRNFNTKLVQMKQFPKVKLIFPVLPILAAVVLLFQLRNSLNITHTQAKMLVSHIPEPKDMMVVDNVPLLGTTEAIQTESPSIFENTRISFLKNSTENPFQEIQDQLLNEQRNSIADELSGYNMSLNINSLIFENNGQPIRNIIFATWRSGSTFLGDLLNSHPATFYHYEPLLHLGVKQVRSSSDAMSAITVLRNLLSCNYSDIPEFTSSSEEIKLERNRYNKRVWRFCQSRSHREICDDPTFLSKMCRLFPFQAMKTVRMRLKFGKTLLDDPGFNTRVLLLVRDPRAIMQSRLQRHWCFKGPDCIEPANLCEDMEEDFKYAKKFRLQYPGQFLTLRYEDISLHPFAATRKIFNFFRLQFHPEVKYFLQTHTVKNHGGVTSTYRNSAKTPFRWARGMLEDENKYLYVQTVQASCLNTMNDWGYLPVMSNNVGSDTNIGMLEKPPWPEMNVVGR